jgi:hypothetical protein
MSVVEFHPPTQQEPEVWQCRCGCHTFWLYSTGAAYCSECRQEAASMNGVWDIPERAESEGQIIPFARNPSESESGVVNN